MTAPLPLTYSEVLINNWEIIGRFMYEPSAYRTLIALGRSRLLDLDTVRIKSFCFRDLPAAIDAAAQMSGLDCTVVSMVAD
jgi:alcohol dehydrogenase